MVRQGGSEGLLTAGQEEGRKETKLILVPISLEISQLLMRFPGFHNGLTG